MAIRVQACTAGSSAEWIALVAQPAAIPAARRLARFALECEPPAEVLEAAALHVLDLLGVALAAACLSCRPKLEDAVGFLGSGNEATAIGVAYPIGAAAAALFNGCLGHALEADDTHIGAVMHGSSVVVPAALAAAERADADGAMLLRAVVAGWEAMIRIGSAFPGDFLRHGFQGTSVAGPFGAALAAGLVRRLTEAQLTSAMGICGSQCGGLFEFLSAGATSKWLHGGWPAMSGLIAVEFAAAGMTGPDTILDGKHGIGSAFARHSDAASALGASMEDLGNTWKIREVAVKLHPVCHFIQPFVECLERLLEDVPAAAVTRITCFVAEQAASLICEPWQQKLMPVTPYQAKWSLPYCLGAILAYGWICPETFDRSSPDPKVMRCAARIDWMPMEADFPRHYPGRVRIVLQDQSERSTEVADVLGSPGRPLSRGAIMQKFRALTQQNIAPGGCEALITAVERLPYGMTAREFGREIRSVTLQNHPPL